MDKDYKIIQVAILIISLGIMLSMFRLYSISIELKDELKVHFIR